MVECPLCRLNLSLFSLRQRDEHANECLERLEGQPGEVVAQQLKLEVPEFSQVPLPEEELPERPEEPRERTPGSTAIKFEPKSEFEKPIPEPSSELLPKPLPEPSPEEPPKPTPPAQDPPNILKRTVPSSGPRKKRTPPFFKFLHFGQTRIAVDAFNYGDLNVPAYYLTHFHSDHYGGLSKSWSHGPIYCTPSTARLCALKLKVDSQYLVPLELETEYVLDGIKVILFDANHCPGAAVFLFNDRVLHTGDFRASKSLAEKIRRRTRTLSKLYLDTTYLDPARTFPDQSQVVGICADYALQVQLQEPNQRFLTRQGPRRVLAIVGTYTIGKERLAVEIAKRLNTRIWANKPKQDILNLLDDQELKGLLSDDKASQVHLVPMRDIKIDALVAQWKLYSKHYTHVIAFSPTGWTWSSKSPFCAELMAGRAIKRDNIQICRVPYSEHSSYKELEMFCKIVRAESIIATVGSKYRDLLKAWEVK